MFDNLTHMNSRRLCRLVFLFGVTSLLVAPKLVAADFMAPPPPAPPTPSPDTYATHVGITIANEVPITESFVAPTISGADLTAVDTAWTVETEPWAYNNGVDIPSELAVVVIFRGKQGELDGAPQEGVNYVLTHHGLSGNATTTISEQFGLPALGDASTPAGTYTIAIAQIPESKFVVTNVLSVDENGVELVEGYDAPYTDQDFINWFAGTDTNGTQPETMRTLEFEYIAGTAHVPCTQDCFSNVLFLPGIEASRLYRPEIVGDGEDKLWEPGISDDLSDLYTDSAGTSVRSDVYVKVGDVLDETPVGKNIYKSFITEMDELEADGVIDWTAAAYDWRLSLDQILSRGKQEGDAISYLEATSTPYIIQELRQLAGTSKSGKVTIIAHSNGGLLAKRLTQTLGDEASELIDRMILIASPQAGTPLAVAAGMHGYDQALAKGLVVSARSARAFATTSPMFYHLLPSERYFTYVDDPIISFDEELEDWIAKYGDVIHSGESLHNFLVDSYGRVDAKTGDINQPVQMHEGLLDGAEALHAELDAWTPPDGIELIQIAGWGVDSTASGIEYVKKGDGLKPNPTFTIDGDGTVVVPSALWTSASAEVSNYWVDLAKYNRISDKLLHGRLTDINHADFLEVPELLSFLRDGIKEEVKALSSYTYLFSNAPTSNEARLRFELHSPLTLDLYDASGNPPGVSTTPGEVGEGIPGTYYITFGEQQYIFADSGRTYSLALDGYDSGTFTLAITETEGDTAISNITFADVPVTPETIVTLSVPSGIDSISNLSVDEDGDGEVDFTVSEDGTITRAQEEQTVDNTVTTTASGGNGPPATPVAAPMSVDATPSLVATTTATSILNEVPVATSSTTTVAEVEQIPEKRIAVQPSAKPKTVVATTTTNATVMLNAQVASVAQVAKVGLWKRLYGWIMKKMREIATLKI